MLCRAARRMSSTTGIVHLDCKNLGLQDVSCLVSHPRIQKLKTRLHKHLTSLPKHCNVFSSSMFHSWQLQRQRIFWISHSAILSVVLAVAETLLPHALMDMCQVVCWQVLQSTRLIFGKQRLVG